MIILHKEIIYFYWQNSHGQHRVERSPRPPLLVCLAHTHTHTRTMIIITEHWVSSQKLTPNKRARIIYIVYRFDLCACVREHIKHSGSHIWRAHLFIAIASQHIFEKSYIISTVNSYKKIILRTLQLFDVFIIILITNQVWKVDDN